MATKISASMIVRNEEDGIAKALASLSKIRALDEIVIIDTGSTDHTREIARHHGAVVSEERWTGNFSFHRNRCLNLCKNDWVLILDGDEEIVDAEGINEFFEHPTGDGLALTVESTANGEVEDAFLSIRAFHKRKGRWKYPIHNQIVGLEDVIPVNARINAKYDDDVMGAAQRRLTTLLEYAENHPEDPHYSFFIAKAYRILFDLDSMKRWAEKYMSLGTTEMREAEVWVMLFEAAMHEGEEEQAYTLLEQGLSRHPEYPDLLHIQMSLAAKEWYHSVVKPNPKYLSISCRTRKYAARLPHVVSAIGIPLGFAEQD